jgi:DNA-directed RNA polymerase specialized sigma24 family protein
VRPTSASPAVALRGEQVLNASDEFEALLGRVTPELQRALVASFGFELGREVTVDALAWAWTHESRLSAMANPGGYLYRVGVSIGRKAVRREKRQASFVTTEHASVVGDPVEPGLDRALVLLTPSQRGAVLLVHGYGFTLAEAAARLGCSVSTLRNHLARGLKKLQHELGVES